MSDIIGSIIVLNGLSPTAMWVSFNILCFTFCLIRMMQHLSTANIINSLTGKLSPQDQEDTPPTPSPYSLKKTNSYTADVPVSWSTLLLWSCNRDYTAAPPSGTSRLLRRMNNGAMWGWWGNVEVIMTQHSRSGLHVAHYLTLYLCGDTSVKSMASLSITKTVRCLFDHILLICVCRFLLNSPTASIRQCIMCMYIETKSE